VLIAAGTPAGVLRSRMDSVRGQTPLKNVAGKTRRRQNDQHERVRGSLSIFPGESLEEKTGWAEWAKQPSGGDACFLRLSFLKILLIIESDGRKGPGGLADGDGPGTRPGGVWRESVV